MQKIELLNFDTNTYNKKMTPLKGVMQKFKMKQSLLVSNIGVKFKSHQKENRLFKHNGLNKRFIYGTSHRKRYHNIAEYISSPPFTNTSIMYPSRRIFKSDISPSYITGSLPSRSMINPVCVRLTAGSVSFNKC